MSSTFFVTADNVIVITVHVIDPSLSGLIWDMEIFFTEQTPPWPGGQPITGPQGWQPFPVPGGIGWMTHQPVAGLPAGAVHPPVAGGHDTGDTIWLHMTDQNHNNLGYVISHRVRQTGFVPGSTLCAPE